PKGFLFLGTAETVDGEKELFSSYSRPHHVYLRRHAEQKLGYPVPAPSQTLRPLLSLPEPPPRVWDQVRDPPPPAFLHKTSLEQYTPSVMVDAQFDIVHMSENVLPFLQMKAGELSKGLLELVREELRLGLRTALYQSLRENV